MMKKILFIACLLLAWSATDAQQSKTIKKSLIVKGQPSEFWFCLCNVNGSITAEAYDGNTIELSLEKRILSKSSQANIDDLDIEVVEGGDYTKVMMIHPNYERREVADATSCNWNWERRRSSIDFRYEFNYKLKIPKGVHVRLSTVNEGDIAVAGLNGDIYLSNVNGDVSIEGARANVKASTVNGRVDVSYASMQAEFGEFDTVNGDIYLILPDQAAGVFNFETRWGKVYSDVDFDERVAPKMQKVSKGGMTKYKMANANGYKIASGGPQLDFETLNGDIRIKRKK